MESVHPILAAMFPWNLSTLQVPISLRFYILVGLELLVGFETVEMMDVFGWDFRNASMVREKFCRKSSQDCSAMVIEDW